MTNDKNYTEQAEQEGRQGGGWMDGNVQDRQIMYTYISGMYTVFQEKLLFLITTIR